MGESNLPGRVPLATFSTADEAGVWRDGDFHFVGFTFEDPNSAGRLAGWMEVEITNLGNGPDNQLTAVVRNYAYEDSGAPITVVPTPGAAAGGLGLLAMGAAGLRRRRQSKQLAAGA